MIDDFMAITIYASWGLNFIIVVYVMFKDIYLCIRRSYVKYLKKKMKKKSIERVSEKNKLSETIK